MKYDNNLRDENGKVYERFKTIENEMLEARGDIYSYKNAVYSGLSIHMNITCNKHGSFKASPALVLKRECCDKCISEKSTALRLEKHKAKWIEKSIALHGDRYLYDNVDYVTCKTKVSIGCKHRLHPNFMVAPHKHIDRTRGCPVCGEAGRLIYKNNGCTDSIYRVYYGHIDGTYKIGVTARSIEYRMNKDKKFELVHISEPMDAHTAIGIEQRIIKKFKKWKSDGLAFSSGRSETFTLDILKNPSKTIERMSL